MKLPQGGARPDQPLIISLTIALSVLALCGAVAAFLLSQRLASKVSGDEYENARASACSELASLAQALGSGQKPRIIEELDQRWQLPERVFRYRFRALDDIDAGHLPGVAAEIPDRLTPAGTISSSECFGSTLSPNLDGQLKGYFRPGISLATFSAAGVQYVVASLWRQPDKGSYDLQVAAPETQPAIERVTKGERQQSMLWALLAIGIAAGGSALHFLYRRRIAALSEVFERVQRGDWAARPAPSRRRDEIAVLGEQIAAKLDLMENQAYAIERVGIEIAHELAQPLASLLLGVFNAGAVASEPAVRQRLDQIYQELNELGPVLNELLDLGRASGLGRRSQVRFEDVDLSSLLDSLVAAATAGAAAKGITLNAALEPGVIVLGTKAMLRTLFGNIIDNAIKYTDAGGVDVSLSRRGSTFVAAVRDTGPGLSSNAAARLATPFYRAPATEGKNGNGIGMTLVYSMAARHGFMLPPPRQLEPGLEVAVTGSTFAGYDAG